MHFGALIKCNQVLPALNIEPLPPPLVELLDRWQASGIFTANERPDTCCLNAYLPGEWLPPHVDSRAFDRPFFTLSLLSAQDVVFGEHIGGDAGDWSGGLRFTMPPGSVLVVGGAAAGPTCQHALPSATEERLSLTFRKLGRTTLDRFQNIRDEAEASRRARRARRAQAKLDRGRTPLALALGAGAGGRTGAGDG